MSVWGAPVSSPSAHAEAARESMEEGQWERQSVQGERRGDGQTYAIQGPGRLLPWTAVGECE